MGHMDFAQLLHDHDLKATTARIALLEALEQEPHLSAETLEERLAATDSQLSSQAVYNALNELTERGILRRFMIPATSARYEIERKDNHHHAVCTSCGRIENVPCAHGSAPCFHPGGTSSFNISIADVLFYGQCSDGCGPNAPSDIVF